MSIVPSSTVTSVAELTTISFVFPEKVGFVILFAPVPVNSMPMALFAMVRESHSHPPVSEDPVLIAAPPELPMDPVKVNWKFESK